MAKRLDGKVVLISGTASGQGRLASLVFGREGAHVYGADVNEPGGQETVEMARAENLDVDFMTGDLSDEPTVEAWVARALDRHGSIDILYNNASSTIVSPVEDTTIEAWNANIRNEMTNVFLPTKHALPHMNPGGVVINIASVAGIRGAGTVMPGNAPGGWAHAATKAAVRAMTRCWAIEFAPRRIRCVSISPGLIDTAATAPMKADPVLGPAADKLTLAGRWGKPEDIVMLALWLCTEEASFVNGIDITVDGGWTAMGTGYPSLEKLVTPGNPATSIKTPDRSGA